MRHYRDEFVPGEIDGFGKTYAVSKEQASLFSGRFDSLKKGGGLRLKWVPDEGIWKLESGWVDYILWFLNMLKLNGPESK